MSAAQEPPKQPRRPAEEEAALIGALRKRVESTYKEYQATCKTASGPIDEAEVANLRDYDYLRFIRARKYDVDAAYTMIMAALEWRTKEKPHLIKESEIASEFKKGKAYFAGYDKQNRIICWLRVRLHFGSSSDAELTRKMCLWFIERGLKMIHEDSPYAAMVFDLTGFSLSNMDYKFVKYLIDIFANYYPDTLGVALILNSPWLFSGCWRLIKPWVDPVTATKVVFIETKNLPEWMDKSVIPREGGGELDVDFSRYESPAPEAPERHDPTPFFSRKMYGAEKFAPAPVDSDSTTPNVALRKKKSSKGSKKSSGRTSTSEASVSSNGSSKRSRRSPKSLEDDSPACDEEDEEEDASGRSNSEKSQASD